MRGEYPDGLVGVCFDYYRKLWALRSVWEDLAGVFNNLNALSERYAADGEEAAGGADGDAETEDNDGEETVLKGVDAEAFGEEAEEAGLVHEDFLEEGDQQEGDRSRGD
jgi:hypothetical protein